MEEIEKFWNIYFLKYNSYMILLRKFKDVIIKVRVYRYIIIIKWFNDLLLILVNIYI